MPSEVLLGTLSGGGIPHTYLRLVGTVNGALSHRVEFQRQRLNKSFNKMITAHQFHSWELDA